MNHSYGGLDKDNNSNAKLPGNDISIQGKNSVNPAQRKVDQTNIDHIFSNNNATFKGKNSFSLGKSRPDVYDNSTGKQRRVQQSK